MKKIYLAIIFALVSTMGAWAQINYISEVKISAFGKSKLQKDGYIVVDQDLNAHEGGADVYIGYKTTTNPAEAITDLVIMESGYDWRGKWYDVREDKFAYDNWVIPYKGAYYRRCAAYGDSYVDCDLNRHSGGADITLYYTKDHNQVEGKTLLTELTAVEQNKNLAGYTYVRHWIYNTDENSTAENDVYGNTNERNGTFKIYLVYKYHRHHYEVTFDWADDNKSCTVSTHCECGDGSTGNATVTSKVKTPATYREDGTVTYTAEIRLQGVKYTDSRDVQEIEMPLDDAKEAVKGLIDQMIADETRADVSETAGASLKALVDAATTRQAILDIMDSAQDAINAAVAEAIAQAKSAAKAEIQEDLQGVTDEAILAVANTACTDIDNASSVAEINAALAEYYRLKELILAKEEAISFINTLVNGSTDAGVLSVANDYIARINDAESISVVSNLRNKAEESLLLFLADPIAFAFTFSGANMPAETQHKLDGLRMTYSEDGEQMTFTVNGTTVTYPLSQVGELSLFRGTPAVELTTHENPADPGFYYTTFYSGLEAYAIPEDVKAFTAELTFAGDALIVTQITSGVLPQDEGVLLESTSDAITLEATNPAAGTKDNGNVFRGSDVYINHPAGTTYVISAVDNVMAFYQYTGDVIPANKAYMNLSEGQSAPRRIVWSTEHTGVATGMEHTAATDQAEKFLHNGTLYIRKGEHVYNVQGVIVK